MASSPQAPGSPHRGRHRDIASGDHYSSNDGSPVSERESSIESALNGLRTLFETTQKKAGDLKRELRLRKYLLRISPSRSARRRFKGLKEIIVTLELVKRDIISAENKLEGFIETERRAGSYTIGQRDAIIDLYDEFKGSLVFDKKAVAVSPERARTLHERLSELVGRLEEWANNR